jgi:7-keto-8-aminopelargonate synthetase-like enzyme
MDLAKSFLQAMNPQNVSSSTAPTMRAGSAEAYKFIQEQNERRAQRAEQKALFERMIVAIERGNDINRNKGVVGTIRN